jgi:hypothetical protein
MVLFVKTSYEFIMFFYYIINTSHNLRVWSMNLENKIVMHLFHDFFTKTCVKYDLEVLGSRSILQIFIQKILMFMWIIWMMYIN